MNRAQILLGTLALTQMLIVHASESANEIRSLVPDSIEVEVIEESDGYVDILGTAPDNEEISSLMRIISQSRRGDPKLESIERENGASRFRVRVRLRD